MSLVIGREGTTTDDVVIERATGGTRWRLRREAALRGAGFPARRVLALSDPDLARAADALHGDAATADEYADAYRSAGERLSRAVAETAADPLFREAVAWQNPVLVRLCLDKLIGRPGTATRNVKRRLRELAVAAHLQRYCLKNDTIGFFGPVGWATLSPDDATDVVAGPVLLARRTTYFECWAVERLARAIADRDDVSGWLRPRRDPATHLVGRRLHRPRRPPLVLTPAQMRLLDVCDGTRTVDEVLSLDPDALSLLLGLRDAGAVRTDLLPPISARPEQWLRERLQLIGDSRVRAEALRPLDDLERARDAVSAAAGHPERLLAAMTDLNATFTAATGAGASHRPGEVYAGRTLVYEDTVRDVRLRLGPEVLTALTLPLALALDSAQWLVAEIAEGYRLLFQDLLDAERRRTGADAVPLARLLHLAGPELIPPPVGSPRIVLAARAEFQKRWERVLGGMPDGCRRVTVTADDLAPRATELFPARPAPWSCGRLFSPDVLLAAGSVDALRRGDLLCVLGELHVATNTMESRLFVEQHPDPDRVLRAAGTDHGSRRVLTVPPRNAAYVTSRLAPPTAVLWPGFTYVSGGDDAVEPPPSAPVWPAAGLLVEPGGDDLVVRPAASSARPMPFLEVIGDLLTSLTATAFQPVAGGGHRPRVVIDRFVLARESWTFGVDDASWAFTRDEARRFALARAWRERHSLPEQVFYTVPVESKPLAADFRSLVLVNLLAKHVRRTAAADRDTFAMSEMLPGPDELWLTDAAGERYTCELRLLATAAEDRCDT